MANKTDTEVVIGGKVYTLSGYESEDYLQRVASYINNKMLEFSKVDSFRRLNGDKQNVIMQLNIADDYFKAKAQIDMLEEDLGAREKEIYDLKHELVANQMKSDTGSGQIKKLKAELEEANKKIMRLENAAKNKQA